jgi:hypothetical protein
LSDSGPPSFFALDYSGLIQIPTRITGLTIFVSPVRFRAFRAVLLSGKHLEIVFRVSTAAGMRKFVVDLMDAPVKTFASLFFKPSNRLPFCPR